MGFHGHCVSSPAARLSVLCDSHSDLLPNDCFAVQALMASGLSSHTHTHTQPRCCLHVKESVWVCRHTAERIFPACPSYVLTSQISVSVFLCIKHNGVCVRQISRQAGRLTDMHPFLCHPSDKRQYEPGAGLCVPAGLLALWQRVGLQTLCLCRHTPHTPHAGGGGGQLVVVCINFLSICAVFPCVS